MRYTAWGGMDRLRLFEEYETNGKPIPEVRIGFLE